MWLPHSTYTQTVHDQLMMDLMTVQTAGVWAVLLVQVLDIACAALRYDMFGLLLLLRQAGCR